MATDPTDAPMTHREYMQIYHLPMHMERAYRRVDKLEAIARRYGYMDLLRNPKHVNEAWDRAIAEGQETARQNGDSIGFQDDGH